MSSSATLSLCSNSYFPPPTLKFVFKFPSKRLRSPLSTLSFGAECFKISSSFISDQSSEKNGRCNLNKRRGLLFAATLPFILPLHDFVVESDAKAIESGASEYLLMKQVVSKVVSKGKAAGVLRLAFHDAGTFEMDENSGGMNGSIIYELERPENAGLKKSLKVLEKAKSEVDAIQPVSWTDMIAVGGAVAVSVCGGPTIPVSIGRLDSVVGDPEGKLPQESLDASGLKQCFQRKGFSAQELVALSGAHTLGSKGFGNPVVFDNSYYKILLEKPWQSTSGMSSMIGLPSDRALVEDDECLRWITKYADDQNVFFEDFKNAYIKLVNSGARFYIV
ncbi:putative L-ascorbate peroxidase 6 [Mangifera indica]|uniref:putative L-ascorbate peroxidase 6 n=1 Tax=Mangifera indica TaxID=29780 RepID=UPI001CFC3305|nr:putative L-ascorbate peroxidase 6 [Mangifera indica]